MRIRGFIYAASLNLKFSLASLFGVQMFTAHEMITGWNPVFPSSSKQKPLLSSCFIFWKKMKAYIKIIIVETTFNSTVPHACV